jgi:hypothetical protein
MRKPIPWRLTVGLVALAAFALRLAIIAHSHGGSDLRIYLYFSRLALHGADPYKAPAGGAIAPHFADSPPLEFLAFAGLLALHDSASTLRVLFALADTLVILLVGFAYPRPQRWRAGFILFYAFNPFVLVAWTGFAEDKTVIFLGVVLLLIALERARDTLAWAAAAALTAFKFAGAFMVPALALHELRARGGRALVAFAASVAAVAISFLPWFPHSLDAFAHRQARLGIDPPIHASPMLLLSRLGLYAPIEAKLLPACALVAVLAALAARRIDGVQAMALSLLACYAFLPDQDYNRILLITLPLLLIMRPAAVRWAAIWVVSCFAALGAVIASRGVPHALSAIAGPLRDVFGEDSTVAHVLWMNLLLVLVLVFFALDGRRGTRSKTATAGEQAGRRLFVETARSG